MQRDDADTDSRAVNEGAVGERSVARWRRRALTVPAYVVALAGLVALAPLLLPVLAALDLATDRRFPRVRCLLFAAVYLACEIGGLAACAGLWMARPLASREAWLGWHSALQTAWAGALFGAAAALFAFRVEARGTEAAVPGPLLVFVRHASVADTLLPAVFLTGRHGLRLRYVLKRELLWDPCLDVVGQRLPNVFVRRGAGDGAHEIAAVRALAADLGPRDGVLIYPEGTRFTPAKRARRLAEIASYGDAARAERAARLGRVLPPRRGGPLALVDAAPEADVLVIAHTGFEGIETFGDAWSGASIGRRVRLEAWRVSRTAIPAARAARERWLDELWGEVDAWVRAHEARR